MSDMSPVSSTADRPDVRLQCFNKNYNNHHQQQQQQQQHHQQQQLSEQQGTAVIHLTCLCIRCLAVILMHCSCCASLRLPVRRRKTVPTSRWRKLWTNRLFHKPVCVSLCRSDNHTESWGHGQRFSFRLQMVVVRFRAKLENCYIWIKYQGQRWFEWGKGLVKDVVKICRPCCHTKYQMLFLQELMFQNIQLWFCRKINLWFKVYYWSSLKMKLTFEESPHLFSFFIL